MYSLLVSAAGSVSMSDGCNFLYIYLKKSRKVSINLLSYFLKVFVLKKCKIFCTWYYFELFLRYVYFVYVGGRFGKMAVTFCIFTEKSRVKSL